MEDLLIEILETFGYPVKRQGSLGNDPYPDRFFTFWCRDSYDGTYYDNNPISIIEIFDVNFYSIEPDETHLMLKKARVKLKEHGFIVDGAGHDVDSDEQTHTGRGINVMYNNYDYVEQED